MYTASEGLIEDRPLPLLPVLRNSTRDTPLDHEVWQDQNASPVDFEVLGALPPGTVAELTAWDLGGLVLTRSVYPPISFRRTLRRVRGDGLDHWVLAVPRRGVTRTSGAGRLTRSGPGSLTIQSLHTTFEGDTTAMEAIHLYVPRDFCRNAAGVLDAADNTEVRTGLGGLLADYLDNVERRLPLMTREDLPRLQDSIRAMVLACVVPSPETMFDARETIQASALERARSIIQRRLFSPTLGSNELCAELGMSRSRLYRLFEPLGGVVHYIRQRRLLAAHVALSDEDDHRTILQIAAACGFMEPAEFSRAFKREFGYRPTDARGHASLRALRGRNGHSRLSNGRRTLSDLLLELQ